MVITDLAVRILQQWKSQGDVQMQLSVPALSRGVYLCSVYSEGIFVGTQRIVLIK
jgi:hypothetical protein